MRHRFFRLFRSRIAFRPVLAHQYASQGGAAYGLDSRCSPGPLYDEKSGARRPDHCCRICGTALRAGAGHCHQCGAMVLPTPNHLEQTTATTGSTTCEWRYAR